MKKHGKGLVLSLAMIAFLFTLCVPVHLNAQFLPLPPPLPYYNPYYAYGYGVVPAPIYIPPIYIPPVPTVRGPAATVTLVLPTATLVPGTVPVVSAPIISTTQLFLGLLLTIGEESGLYYTNPALFWYLVGILY